MVTFLILRDLLKNTMPDRYDFTTKHIRGKWINIYKRNVLDIQVVTKHDGLLPRKYYRITVTLPQYTSIKEKLNQIREDRYELLNESK